MMEIFVVAKGGNVWRPSVNYCTKYLLLVAYTALLTWAGK